MCKGSKGCGVRVMVLIVLGWVCMWGVRGGGEGEGTYCLGLGVWGWGIKDGDGSCLRVYG